MKENEEEIMVREVKRSKGWIGETRIKRKLGGNEAK